jgi:hypothetical protein
MIDDIDLTGTWVGEYYQHDRAHPIAATLVQAGEALSGSMRDGEPDQDMSVTEATAGSGEDERIVARLRQLFPDAPAAPVRVISHLAPESTLEGCVSGTGVYFVKSYRGACFGGYRVGDRVVGRKVEDHVVHYSGRLGSGGREIEGRWWIDPRQDTGGRRIEGSFTLRRGSEAARGKSDAGESR